eukprot:TRINITY_DN12869_c0_g1_i1.p1 TRINITY_DN12869_c0_g1~~TRINITY_DN12869_c0_g1_i1.p1  ORF type:complete len:437 (+),score=156.62 TRINITY_DN12869_c0_g1_i1:49-1311(+)
MAWVEPSNVECDDFDWDGAREVGVGALARIFVAKCLKDGQHYAVKSIAKGSLIHTNKVEAAMGEKTLLNRMKAAKQPYVARLYSTFQTSEELFYCMEYFPRGNLEMLCMRGPVASRAAIAEIAAMVLQGLEAIHQSGWVHRDIKPENICFREDCTIGIIDFDTALQGDFKPMSSGMTKSIKEQSSEERNKRYSVTEVQAMRKKSQQFVGTAQFMSPEMLGSCTWSYCSDLWALGCIVYQLATGVPPFFAESQFSIFQLIVKNKVDYSLISDPVLRGFCEALLKTDPTQRLGCYPPPSDPNYLKPLKDHALFESVNWGRPNTELLQSLQPTEDKEYLTNMLGEGDGSFDDWVASKHRELLGAACSDGPCTAEGGADACGGEGSPTSPRSQGSGGESADDTMDIVDDANVQAFTPFVFGNAA